MTVGKGLTMNKTESAAGVRYLMNADLDVLQSKVLNSCSRPNSGIYKIGSGGEVYCTEQLALASTVTEIGRQVTELQNRSALARAPVPLNVYRNFTESAQREHIDSL